MLRIKKNRRVPFDLTLSMIPVMAYVEPRPDDQGRLEALPYRDTTWYLNAGIIANLMLAFSAGTATALVDGKWLTAAVLAAFTATIWLARRPIAAYALPALSVPALGVLIWSMIGYSFSLGHTGFGFASLIQDMPHHNLDLPGSLWLFASINLVIAILNMTPVFGDNGRVIHAILSRWSTPKIARFYQVGAITAVIALFAVSILSDLTALALKIF